VLSSRLVFAASFLALTLPAKPSSLLILRFHNDSHYADLDWVGESVAETLRSELSQAGQIVLDRESNEEGMKRLSLRPDANYTKATIIRLGQSLDADYVIYGSYELKLAPDDSSLKDGSVQVTAQFIDLRKLHNGPDVSETGKLADLSRLDEHLAWECTKYVDAGTKLTLDSFMAPEKSIRLDAEESYIRGLLSGNQDQQQKWFLQAANLDAHFAGPAYELGKLYLERKDYRQAMHWLERVPAGDSRYPDAHFRMGLSAYQAADYNAAQNCFREVAKAMPLNEVYNNLGAAEDQLNQPAALDDFRHAVDGDPNDPVYLFNLGAALLRRNLFEEAGRRLEAVTDRSPGDQQAAELLERARNQQASPPGAKPLLPYRLKEKLDATAFRQLKAMLAPKAEE
jgi:tetratricopeptide (TPR) repeat protein